MFFISPEFVLLEFHEIIIGPIPFFQFLSIFVFIYFLFWLSILCFSFFLENF
jgi:hypothetical protein